MPKTAPVAAAPIADFERSLDELESLVQRLEHGELSLDDSLKTFERGMTLYRNCHQALEQAELKVNLLLNPADPASAVPFESDTP
jgi:exodeoxyribonuclease VII small subunit